MKKLTFKNVFSRAFVVSLAAIAVSGMDVNALSINETAGNEITNGSFIIGITRFSDTSVSGQMIVDATINDQAYARNNPNYAGSRSIYYYDEDWYVLDNKNNAIYVDDANIVNSLNSQDIFYVNNVEKTVDTITYERDIPSGYELVFDTDKGADKVSYNANDKIMTIYATANTVTVKLHKTTDTDNSKDTLMDTFVKTYDEGSDVNFSYAPSSQSAGTITADGGVTDAKDVTISNNGNTINIGGTIKWTSDATGASLPSEKGTAGYRVGVQISLPNGTSTADLSKINVYVNGVKNVPANKLAWTGNSLIYTPIVENGKSSTLVIEWLNGTTQTFTINVNGTLEAKPAGKVSGENIYVKDSETGKPTDEVRLSGTAATDNSKITFSGKSADLNGDVVVYIEPDSRYRNTNPTVTATRLVKDHTYNPNDKFTTKTEYKKEPLTVSSGVVTLEDGRRVIAVTVPFSEDTTEVKGRTVSLNVAWDTAYNQPIDVVLDSATPFAYPTVEFDKTAGVKYTSANDGTMSSAVLPTTKEPDTVKVENVSIAWDKVNGGNRIVAVVDASAFSGNVGTMKELDFLTLELDGKEVKYETTEDNKKVEKTLTFNTASSDIEKVLDNVNIDVTTTPGKATWTFALADDYSAAKGEEHTVTVKYAGKVVKTLTVKVNAVANKVSGGRLELVAGNTDFYLDTADNNLTLFSKEVYDSDNKLTYNKVPYDYSIAYNAIEMQLTNSDYASFTGVTATAKVGDGEEFDLAIDATSKTVKVPVTSSRTTVVTVKWDAKNTQTFNVTTKSDKIAFEERGNGSVKLTGDTTLDADDTRTDKTKLIFSNNAIRDNTGYNVSFDASNHGVSIKLPTLPAGVSATDVIDAAKGYVSVNGGIYQNTNASDTDTYLKVNLNDSANLTKYGIALNGDTITLPIYVAENSKRVVVTVAWNEHYVVNYTIDASSATLKNDAKVTLTAGSVTSDAEDKVAFEGAMAYANGYYELGVALSGTVSSVEIDDANREGDVYKNVNGTAVLVPTNRTKDNNVAIDASDFKLYFTESKKTATVKVTLTNGDVQNFVVNAGNAIYPSIKLNSNVKYDALTGKYSLTVNKGDTFDLIGVYNRVDSKSVTVSGSQTPAYPSTEVTDVVKAIADSTSYEAINAGTVTMNVSGKAVIKGSDYAAQSYTVEVTVLEAEDTPVTISAETRTYTNEGKKYVEITATPNGGRNKNYTVDVTVEKFDTTTGKYAVDGTIAVTPITQPNADGKYVTTVEIAEDTHYRYVVKATTNAAAGSLPTNYLTASVVKDEDPKSYEVKFVDNNGNTIETKTVAAGTNAVAPSLTRTDDTYYYVLKGWYNVDDIDIKEGNNTKTMSINGATAVEIDANNDIILADNDAFDAEGVFNATTGFYSVVVSDAASVSDNITLRAVWYRIPLEK